MTNKLKTVQYVTKQNLTKAFGSFEGKMNRRFDRLEGSIEQLADAVRQGFEGVDRRFEAMDKKIDTTRDELKADIKGVNNRWYRQQEIVDETRTGLDVLAVRVKKVEVKVGLGAG